MVISFLSSGRGLFSKETAGSEGAETADVGGEGSGISLIAGDEDEGRGDLALAETADEGGGDGGNFEEVEETNERCVIWDPITGREETDEVAIYSGFLDKNEGENGFSRGKTEVIEQGTEANASGDGGSTFLTWAVVSAALIGGGEADIFLGGETDAFERELDFAAGWEIEDLVDGGGETDDFELEVEEDADLAGDDIFLLRTDLLL